MSIRVGICGHGNLGRGVEHAIMRCDDMELVAIFTRRNPSQVIPVTQGARVIHIAEVLDMKAQIDVMVLCGGSVTDLPQQTPEFAEHFNVVDSFDTHADIPAHFEKVDAAAKRGGRSAIISAGWDPGLFSLNRMMSNAILPDGCDYTFWGKGLSQGHSDAIRRIPGVVDARQYTVPIESALHSVRSGENPYLTPRQKHRRECYVVAQEDADKEKIRQEIVNMPNYFSDYDTSVTFVTREELLRDHNEMPHGGFVIRSGKTGDAPNGHIIEYRLKLDSNPEFTASVLVAYARAAYRLNREGEYGCRTIFDIPPAYISPLSEAELRERFL
ncbi:MAG: diaminopimelate dehydrogenase [Clostridiales bacterium]|jgi:diaminopimelate dehydrogenase|nr:diaminopimelate dehydrogenase [Clostridiales bacterium]